MKMLKLWYLLILLPGLPKSLAAMSPPLEYESSWIGNSYPGGQLWVPQDIDHIFVTGDGTVYSNVHWEEGGGNVTAFKDGEVLGPALRTYGWGNPGGYAVAANDKHLYIGGRMNNEGGGLKDPDTWPPKDFDWIGVSRRHRSDIQKGAPFPGGKGGKVDTVPRAFLVVDEVPTGSGPDERRLRNITGLWATTKRLYVSCPYDDPIKVFDAESMARLDEWSVERPGVLAMDGDGVLWTLLEPDGASPRKVIALNPPQLQEFASQGLAFPPEAQVIAEGVDGGHGGELAIGQSEPGAHPIAQGGDRNVEEVLEEFAGVAEDAAQWAGHGEDEMAVREAETEVEGDPFGELARVALGTAWAEAAAFAGEGEEPFVAAVRTAGPGEARGQIAAAVVGFHHDADGVVVQRAVGFPVMMLVFREERGPSLVVQDARAPQTA